MGQKMGGCLLPVVGGCSSQVQIHIKCNRLFKCGCSSQVVALWRCYLNQVYLRVYRALTLTCSYLDLA